MDCGNFCNLTNSTSSDADLRIQITGTILLVLVWPFVVFDFKRFPIGRPGAALLGGLFMVLLYVIPQDDVLGPDILGKEDNLQTLFLLIGMMMLSHYFDREGLLKYVASKILGRSNNKPPFWRVLWKVSTMTAILAALITNDAACVVVTPLLLNEHHRQKRSKREVFTICIAIATSANIGSAATFFGNPQNAFIASAANVGLLQFLFSLAPAAVFGLLVNIFLLYLYYYVPKRFCRRRCKEEAVNPEQTSNDLESGTSENTGDNPPEQNKSPDQVPDPFEPFEDYSIHWQRELNSRNLEPDAPVTPTRASLIAFERDAMVGDMPFTNLTWTRRTDPGFRPRRRQRKLSRMARSGSFEHIKNNQEYGSLSQSAATLSTSIRSLPTGQPDGNLDMLVSANRGASATEQDREPDETTPALANEKGKFSHYLDKFRKYAFVIWLFVVTIVMLALLAVPNNEYVTFNLGLVPFGAAIITMLADCIIYKKRAYDVIQQIDWTLIMLFIGLFVWLEGFNRTGFPDLIVYKLQHYMRLNFPDGNINVAGIALFTVFILIGSNVLSNVPLTILIVNQLPDLYYHKVTTTPVVPAMLLAWVATVAGNFTLIGSIANLLVAEKSKSSEHEYTLGFFNYLKFGAVSTLLVTLSGVPVVYGLAYVAEKYFPN